jgi:hypothetical protein
LALALFVMRIHVVLVSSSMRIHVVLLWGSVVLVVRVTFSLPQQHVTLVAMSRL